MRIKAAFVGLCLIAFPLFSTLAQINLPVPKNIAQAYSKGTRSANGAPGKNYWQNTADYTINVAYQPQSRVVEGEVAISYINNSPDDLHRIFLKLYPNIYKAGVQRNMDVQPEDITEGITISEWKLNGVSKDLSALKVNGTNMSISENIKSKTKVDLYFKYRYVLNKNSHIRQGVVDSGAAFIAYFFPRVAVYDDVDGWNNYAYLGTQEFYNDFCNFNVKVTVPKDYLVWATGDLTNCNEVLREPFCSRIMNAERSENPAFIVTPEEAKLKNITAQKDFNTWNFTAKNVTDFAFAVSDHYVWKSSSVLVDNNTGRRTRVDAVYNPDHKDYENVQHEARLTVDFMSSRFPKWPFPFQHMTVFDGLDQMEYPMMANDNPLSGAESVMLTTHEIFHTMFPFYMGTNETKYGWMDEGWATIGEWILSPMIDSSIVDDYGVSATVNLAGTEHDMPIASTLTTNTNGPAAFINAYPKPALGYLYAKDILGDELFFKGLHHYIKNWNGKHPIPNDFFNSMNTGSGKNLNWFWKKWFYENGVGNIAIKSFTQKGFAKTLVVQSKGEKSLPVDAVITFTDGSKITIHRSPAVWEKSNICTIPFNDKRTVQSIVLSNTYLADADDSDNNWVKK